MMAVELTPEETTKANIMIIAERLRSRLGRVPTEEEVTEFIFGDALTRSRIWNQKWEGRL